MTRTTEIRVEVDGVVGLLEVTGDVTISEDGSEYEVELLEVRDGDRWAFPDALTPAQQEHAKDLLCEQAREDGQ